MTTRAPAIVAAPADRAGFERSRSWRDLHRSRPGGGRRAAGREPWIRSPRPSAARSARRADRASRPTRCTGSAPARRSGGDRGACSTRSADPPTSRCRCSSPPSTEARDGRGASTTARSGSRRRFWPGALTLVLPRRREQPRMGPGRRRRDGRACGCPSHPLALALLAVAGPLAVTSANRSGEPPADAATSCAAAFGDLVAVYLCESDAVRRDAVDRRRPRARGASRGSCGSGDVTPPSAIERDLLGGRRPTARLAASCPVP